MIKWLQNQRYFHLLLELWRDFHFMCRVLCCRLPIKILWFHFTTQSDPYIYCIIHPCSYRTNITKTNRFCFLAQEIQSLVYHSVKYDLIYSQFVILSFETFPHMNVFDTLVTFFLWCHMFVFTSELCNVSVAVCWSTYKHLFVLTDPGRISDWWRTAL